MQGERLVYSITIFCTWDSYFRKEKSLEIKIEMTCNRESEVIKIKYPPLGGYCRKLQSAADMHKIYL